MSVSRTVFIAIQLSCVLTAFGQGPGPIGTWRDHFSYINAISVTEGGSKIYCASGTAAYSFDRASGEMERLTKVNALSDVGISGVAFNEAMGMLVVHYSNGNIDLVTAGGSHNMSDIKRSTLLGNKSINSVIFDGTRAYLACGFGVVLLDLERREVRETWLIGPAGSQVNVAQVALSSDSIYAATSAGLLVASRTAPNLAAFDSWHRREDMGEAMKLGPFSAVVSFGGKILLNFKSALPNADTLLVLDNNAWSINEGMSGRTTMCMRVSSSGDRLAITHPFDVGLLDTDLTEIHYTFDYAPQMSAQQAIWGTDSNFWIADNKSGLIRSSSANNGTSIMPDGPRTSSAYHMDAAGGALYVATGSVAGNWGNLFSKDGVYNYVDGTWQSYYPDNNALLQGVNSFGGTVNDMLVVAVDPNDPTRAYAGSWDEGIIEFRNRQPYMIHNETNSTLSQPSSGSDGQTNVAGLGFDASGNLWATNANAGRPIVVRTKDGQWYDYDPGTILGGNYLMSTILPATNGYKWIIRPRSNALIVFNDNGTLAETNDDQYKLMRNETGQGGLPTTDVFAVAEDHDGEIWVGSSKGISVFYNPSAIFGGGDFDSQQILIEQDGNVQILLETEVVTTIKVDGADRKWIGTQASGAFLVSPDGKEEILHFTAENSPLPSNTIISLAIDERTGEVFFGTDRGIISYRGDAIEGADKAECASVFPNPLRPEHAGPVAVTGLMRDSEVKITDMAGNLVYRTASNGGQAIWPGTDMNGERVATGVYLVFASDRDGTSKCNTKVLVVR
jgi:hypothetical protein